jgi:hypothetical protein
MRKILINIYYMSSIQTGKISRIFFRYPAKPVSGRIVKVTIRCTPNKMSKMRISAHKLPVKSGRYNVIKHHMKNGFVFYVNRMKLEMNFNSMWHALTKNFQKFFNKLYSINRYYAYSMHANNFILISYKYTWSVQ